MSTSIATPPFVNGTNAVPAELLREAEFLQKLLQIRDDVFASKHPRIHLPAKVIEQVAPRPTQTTAPGRPATNGTTNGISASQLFPPRPDSSLQAPSTANEPVSPAPPTQRPFSTISASSIDPVLLTKSDHLIRAELQLKRQQIERLLKDQFDKKGRGNDNEEREPHLNVEECLIQAQLRVPPVSGLRSTTNNSDGAESFDENSYYSSKADSWSSEELDHAPNTIADTSVLLTSQAKQGVHGLHDQALPAEPAVIDLDEEAYEPADDIEIYEPESAALPEDVEEEDYSPPPADIGPGEPTRGRARDRGNQNHGGTNGSRRQSPNGPIPPVQNPRKRRRDERRVEKKRQQQANKRPAQSPEPYIKEEPQSPPPFIAYPDSQPSKRRALQPIPNDADVVALQESPRMQPIYHREEPLNRLYREYDEPSSPTVIRVPQRRVQRDEQDLRRVASLQYARRPYSPSGAGDVFAAEPRQMRSASHAYAERPEPPIYREASSRPSAAPRYVQECSRSPVYEHAAGQQSPMLMAPPPRRIVIDQYGNKYYAAAVDARESAAPPPSRRVEMEPYYERAVTREPTMRVQRSELYEDEVGQRMPPPPRRYIDASGTEMVEAPVYRQREASRRPVEIEYRPQYEEMGPPREYIPPRAYSMRPEPAHRELAEGYARHGSIQPGPVRAPQPRYREVSMVHQEPLDDRRYYSAAPQARRYVEEEPLEVGPEAYTPRVYTRY